MGRIVGSFVAGAAGNAFFWFFNKQVELLSGPLQYWAMAWIFCLLFALAYVLLRAKTTQPQPAALASDLEAQGALSVDVSGSRASAEGAVIASRNKSAGDMKVTAKGVDLG